MPIERIFFLEKLAKLKVFHAKIALFIAIFKHIHVDVKIFDD
jgi:hypothetical protein